MLSCNVDRKPFEKRVMISLITLSLSERVLEKMFVQLNNSSSPIWPLQCWQTFFSRCTFSIRTEKCFIWPRRDSQKENSRRKQTNQIILFITLLAYIAFSTLQLRRRSQFFLKQNPMQKYLPNICNILHTSIPKSKGSFCCSSSASTK